MQNKVYTPYIYVGTKYIEIMGEPKGLKALGEMLVLKAKLGKNMSATMTDGTNKSIKITSSDDFNHDECAGKTLEVTTVGDRRRKYHCTKCGSEWFGEKL